MASDAAPWIGVAAAVAAVGGVVWWMRRRAPEPPAGPGGPGGGPGLVVIDPATGLPTTPSPYGDIFTSTPDGAGPGHDVLPNVDPSQTLTPTFSPDFERELLRQNEDVNRQIVAEQEKQTLGANIANAVLVGGTAVVAGPRLVRGLARTPALLRSAIRSPVARVAGPIGASLGLGLAGVAALDQTGALDAIQQFGSQRGATKSATTRTVVKTLALPASVPGAVVTAFVGRGSVGGNLRKALSGSIFG